MTSIAPRLADVLSAHPEVAAAYVFGSVAGGLRVENIGTGMPASNDTPLAIAGTAMLVASGAGRRLATA